MKPFSFRLSLSFAVLVWVTSFTLISVFDIPWPFWGCNSCAILDFILASIVVLPVVLVWVWLFLFWLHWLATGDSDLFWFVDRD